MAEFSSSDIDEAKRRVREMHSRAQGFIEPSNISQNAPNKAETRADNPLGFSLTDFLGNISSSSDSSIILALILILSHEKADNMLILALLYILL